MKNNNYFPLFLVTFLCLISISSYTQNHVTFIPPDKKDVVPDITMDTIITMIDANKDIKKITILQDDIVVREGYLTKNKKTGKWFNYYPSGVLLSLVEYDNDLKNGIYMECDNNGAVLVQEFFKNDKLDGEQKMYYSTKSGRILKSITNYKDGRFHGMCTNYTDNGLMQSQVGYIDGKKDGTTKWYFTNGNLAMEQNYSNDLLNGIQKIYNQEGILVSEGKFEENKKTGIWTEYYDSGKMKSQGSYKEDNKAGNWTYYDESGKISKTEKL